MKLITLDRTKNISYFGDCKVQSNGFEKCLNIKMLDKDPEETMTATYNRIFIQRNNLLCCMNNNFNNVMIIVFPTKEKCKLIYDAVIKEKLRQTQSNNVVALDEKQIFKDCLYLPLVKAVQGGTPLFRGGHQALQSIIAEFVESLDNDEVHYIFNNFPETILVQTPVSTEMEETFVRQRKIVKPMHLTPAEPDTSSFHSARTTFGFSLPTNMHKQLVSHKEDDEKENKTVGTSRKKLKVFRKPSRKASNVSCLTEASSSTPNVFVSDEPSPQNTPENVDFDIVEYLQDGKLDKKLLVFTSNDRKQCYEFTFCKRTISYYGCIKCFDHKKVIKIKSEIHEDGSRTFDFNTEKHICEPIDYLPRNYQSSLIINSSNFKLVQRLFKEKMHPLLIIFASDDRNMCYKFGFDSCQNFFFCYECKKQGRSLTARFIQYEGKTVIEYNRLEHICKPQKYTP